MTRPGGPYSIVALLAGALLASSCAKTTKIDLSCPVNESMCGGACVNEAADVHNCGGCGKACASGQGCKSGKCMAICTTGQTSCSGKCVDLTSDGANCGACGTACPSGQTCQSSQCACPGGQSLCSGACTDTGSDPMNCGACGSACPSGTCDTGRCVAVTDDGGVPDLTMAYDLAGDLTSTGDLTTAVGDGPLGCTPLINEVQTAGATLTDEWVEVFNPCSSAIDLTSWTLGYRSAGNNARTLYTFTQSIPAGGYLLIAGSGFSGDPTLVDGNFVGSGLGKTGGAVALLKSGKFADGVSYGTLTVANAYTETNPAPAPPAGESIARLPNGVSTGDNSKDFQVTTTPTPRAANK